MFLFKRKFVLGMLTGLALGSWVRQRRVTGVTQERLDDYYLKRAQTYNLTDAFTPRVEMRKTLIEMAQLHRGQRILDFACGAGANIPYIREKIGADGHITASDYSQAMLDAAQQEFIVGKGWNNITLVQADAAEMSFPEQFDVVLCTMGLAVIPRWEQALERAWGLVKPGGVLAIGDLKESERPYTQPIRWLRDILDVLIIADSTRKPWEWMQNQEAEFEFRETFHGFFYAATLKKPS
jgi:ubiquinone/menaquinone biosynthesis C-methylase UbiE